MAERLFNGDMQQLANGINDFFYSVSSDLEPLNQSVVPVVSEVCPDKFIVEPFMVEQKLSAINPHKSSGPDNIPNWFWRECSCWLADPVSCIFNASIRQGIVPAVWKCANVIPMPNVNPPSQIETDLRLISLTDTLSKVLESFVGRWILNELEGKLDRRQYGAIKGKSTTHELVDIIHHWHQALDKNESVRTIFIDYARALITWTTQL